MKIYTINLDPETELIDIETEIKEILIKKESKNFYYISERRRISKYSKFTRIFLNKKDAEDYRIMCLRKLKKIYTDNLRKVNIELKGDHIRKYRRPLTMVKVIPPEGDPIICTSTRAMEITGLSRPGVTNAVKKGSKSWKGFYIENIN